MELSAARRDAPARAAPRWLAAAVLGLGAALPGAALDAAPARRAGVPSQALQQLARYADAGPEYMRTDFAYVAIEEVIGAYEFEFERLSAHGQVSARELARQRRWAAALRVFLDGLYAARDALDAGAPVQILVAPPAPVQVLVGGNGVSLESPRIDAPQRLDDAIVTAYCHHFGCDPALLDPALLDAMHSAPELAPSRAPVGGGWSFGAGHASTYETVDGLGFMFADVRARAAKEQACLQVRAELLHLAAELAAQRRAGRSVDFDALRLESAAAAHEQYVVLTPRGPRLRMSLPALARAPGVVEVAREWLRAQAGGEGYRQLFPRADLLLAGLLGSS
jgi:hypothetical protein